MSTWFKKLLSYRADQPFRERMGHGYVRERPDLFDLEDVYVGTPTMKMEQWVVVRTQVPRKRLRGDDLFEYPQNRSATGISAVSAKADDPTCEHVHHHHDPMAAHEYRFATEQIDASESSARTDHRFLLRVDNVSRARGGRCLYQKSAQSPVRWGDSQRGLRRLNSTIASMSSFDGLLGRGADYRRTKKDIDICGS